MNQEEVIDYIFKGTDIAKKDARLAVQKMVEAVQVELRRGGSVTFSGLGMFKVIRTAARVRLHPATQIPIQVPARKKAKFTVFSALDDSVNGR